MGRCFLARLCGDAINAVLAAAGSNLRKLLGLLRSKAKRFVFALIRWTGNGVCSIAGRPLNLLAAA